MHRISDRHAIDHSAGRAAWPEAQVGRPLEHARGAVFEPAAPDVARRVRRRAARTASGRGRESRRADRGRGRPPRRARPPRSPRATGRWVRPVRRARREGPARPVVEEGRDRVVPAGGLVEMRQHPEVREACHVAEGSSMGLGDVDPRRPGVVGDRLQRHALQRSVRRADAADRGVDDRLGHPPVAQRLDEGERRPRAREAPERERRLEPLGGRGRVSPARAPPPPGARPGPRAAAPGRGRRGRAGAASPSAPSGGRGRARAVTRATPRRPGVLQRSG